MSPAEFEAEIRFIGNSLERLKKTFQMEKEEALAEGRQGLLRLRERSRTHYQPRAENILSDLKRLRYRLRELKDAPADVTAEIEELLTETKKLRAYFIGTPGRLLRTCGQNTGDD